MEVDIQPDKNGNNLSMHMNEAGITLRHGEHAGRIIRAARNYAGANDPSNYPDMYTSAIYSDDNGSTWHSSDPFPAFGTGEATIAELSDGRIYYNSRRHWAPEGVSPLRRWSAWSADGGQTWIDLAIVEILPDGPQNTNYGLMGGLIRLPVNGKDILIFSNAESPTGRDHGTVWASFDGADTWPLKRQVDEGAFAYSSLNAGRPGTPSEGWIYLNYESAGSKVARFNLSWLMEGEATGDGVIPELVIGCADPMYAEYDPFVTVEDSAACITLGTGRAKDPPLQVSMTGSRLQVSMPTPGSYILELINVQGKSLSRNKLTRGISLDVSGFPTGIYFVKVRGNNINYLQKTIISGNL
jgi:hypothetical protein